MTAAPAADATLCGNLGDDRIQLRAQFHLRLTLTRLELCLRLLGKALKILRTQLGLLFLFRSQVCGHFLRQRLKPLVGSTSFGRLGGYSLQADNDGPTRSGGLDGAT